jgi:uncharacterized SAM-binding protein YcdF (DUF218 family)
MSFRNVLLRISMVPVFAYLVVSCSYTARKTRVLLSEAREKGPFDAIIVPGVPLEDGKWSRTMKARVYWAKYLYEQGIARNIIFSGGAVATPYHEARVMAMYAIATGVPAHVIYTELKAEHSTENVYYSYKLARKLGFTKIAVASDPFQTRMVKGFVRKKVDPDIVMIPMELGILKRMEPVMIDPVIDFSDLQVADFQPLNEREGFWKRLRGTRGLNIDENAYP